LVPPLAWRRIDVVTDELPIPGAVTEAIAMHLGLDADVSELLPLVAERHLLAAARCMWTAGLHEAPAGRALLRTWITLLGDPWPVHRWVACQCLLHAGNIDEKAGRRLADLAHSDPEPSVRLVAMHALSRCACSGPVASLVSALVAYDVEKEERGIDPGTHL